jgi:hypothetical protein
MFDRKTTRVALTLLSVLALCGDAVFAQQQAQAPSVLDINKAREQRDEKERRTNQGFNGLGGLNTSGFPASVKAAEARRAAVRGIQIEKLRKALTAFDTASEQLSEALGLSANLKDPARQITKSTAVFMDALKHLSEEPSRFDPSEFKDSTPAELGREALTSAERISPMLAAVLQNQTEDTVDIDFLLSLSKLQAELMRLQWMTQRLK